MKAAKRPPVSKPRTRSSNRKPPTRPARPTVLVVDDSPQVLDMLKLILKTKGRFRVMAAETSERALTMAAKRDVDAVISDLNRPGMKGLQFLKAFKEAHPDTPVIILSGSLTEASGRRALRLGAFRCMFKPTTVDEILKVVGEALEARMARARKVPNGTRSPARKQSRKAAARKPEVQHSR